MIENTNFSNEKLNEFDKAILQMEYAIRNAFAQDILRPMLVKWWNEFKESHPDKSLCSNSFYSFGKSKIDDMDLLYIANEKKYHA